ncbi:Elongation factor Ts [uncultured delta proteobacterium]|uniref:Elongation factor Ts n=1 Tax=uncultured delta proteobacterium TaxID=34034 RepID=A0A212KHJ0_9DELT|nr:Elongation factor Ts [uncultured delta proteobacterium]
MAEITAAMVKELRDRTAAGMMDCKNALKECEADIEKAIDWLRQKGLSKAAKKAGRATSEGVVASVAAPDNSKSAIVEVMCETDFVSRGDKFQAFAKSVGKTVFDKEPADTAALLAILGDDVNNQIATLGENISVGRLAVYTVAGNGTIGTYVHANGKIGVMVELACEKAETAKNAKLQELARNLAMQVAAASPAAVDPGCLDPALVEREKEISRQKTLEEGKPANIVEKIVEGRIRKFYEEVCLINQAYIRDDSKSIQALLQEEGKAMGDTLSIKRFVRLQLGEGASEE